jgi:hypothetical protein
MDPHHVAISPHNKGQIELSVLQDCIPHRQSESSIDATTVGKDSSESTQPPSCHGSPPIGYVSK